MKTASMPMALRETNLQWLLRPLHFGDSIVSDHTKIMCVLGRMEQVTGAYAFLTEPEQKRADAWRITADQVMRQLRGVP